jgi:hypothetical protein
MTILAQTCFLIAVQTETFIAYPSAALPAQTKFQAGVQICLFKSRLVFLRPYYLPGFFILYGGKVTLVERQNYALEFLSAAVAKKTKRKLFRIRTVNRFTC